MYYPKNEKLKTKQKVNLTKSILSFALFVTWIIVPTSWIENYWINVIIGGVVAGVVVEMNKNTIENLWNKIRQVFSN
ncbi:MAG: hypothetical protein OXE77_02360 [Flavobacteriaceae bacterium]|nr:hypothetical protein [Flavobacteriaceae bacterium]MCY4266623.1 hypothetical protein [Flavobacteriaceae bacterium]MCY4299473.1 hypothetical protein [Flavobacteriaceae bacterium]